VKPAHPAAPPACRVATAARPLLVGEEGAGDPVELARCRPVAPAADPADGCAQTFFRLSDGLCPGVRLGAGLDDPRDSDQELKGLSLL